MQNLSKKEMSAMLALMCARKAVTRVAPGARALSDDPGARRLIPADDVRIVRPMPVIDKLPLPGEFDPNYIASIMGDQAVIVILDEDGYPVAEEQIARKRGQEWRDEVELQESGEIVGYWGEGQ